VEFEHFWLFCGIWLGLGSYVSGKFRARKLIGEGEISEYEAQAYLLRFSLWIFIPSVIFWLLQLSISTQVSVAFLSWPNPQKTIALSILIGLWGYLLVWSLFLGGAEPLAKCLRLTGNFPTFMLTPVTIKLIVILVVVSGVLSLLSQYE